MVSMTDYHKIRVVVEFEVPVSGLEEAADFSWNLQNGSLEPSDYDYEIVFTEHLSTRHEVDFVLGIDMERELHQLYADGEIVFEHRDHDEVVREYGRRAGVEVNFYTAETVSSVSRYSKNWFLSYGDPDECWKTLKH